MAISLACLVPEPPHPLIYLIMGGQHKDSEGAQNGFFEMDKILNVPEGTASVVDVHAALDPIVLVAIVTSCGGQQGSPVPKDVAKAPASQVISI